MLDDGLPPEMGDFVVFFGEDRQPVIAIVAHAYAGGTEHSDRPICNLATIIPDGRFIRKAQIEPAWHDGVRWHLVNKWAWRKEVPDEEWNYLPPNQYIRADKWAGGATK